MIKFLCWTWTANTCHVT